MRVESTGARSSHQKSSRSDDVTVAVRFSARTGSKERICVALATPEPAAANAGKAFKRRYRDARHGAGSTRALKRTATLNAPLRGAFRFIRPFKRCALGSWAEAKNAPQAGFIQDRPPTWGYGFPELIFAASGFFRLVCQESDFFQLTYPPALCKYNVTTLHGRYIYN